MTSDQRNKVLAVYNPGRQAELCADAEKCVTGNYPTLSDLRECFGGNMPKMWLLPQLFNLSEFCGCKDKLSIGQIEETAMLIARDFSCLKVSELMLFFSLFKTGRWGRFYGAVDPMLIISSLRVFVDEYRSDILERIERRRRDEARAESRRGVIGREEYLALKRRALEGEDEALRLLTPPGGDTKETLEMLKSRR